MLGGANAQLVKICLQSIKTGKQRLHQRGLKVLRTQTFNNRLQPVSHLAQAHGPSQARTALEGMQDAQNLNPSSQVVRAGRPLTQGTTQLWHQLQRFFLEYGEEIGVE